MATRKRHSREQIVRKLMAADRLLAEGKDTAAVCRELLRRQLHPPLSDQSHRPALSRTASLESLLWDSSSCANSARERADSACLAF
jgi:hypothetical protein